MLYRACVFNHNGMLQVPVRSGAWTNLGSARMSMFELENASENICTMRLGLASKAAAGGGIAQTSLCSVCARVGMGLTLERR